MLKTEQMSTIAVMIGTTVDELTKAISDEKEVKLTLPEGRFLTKTNEETLLDNHGKKKYDEGVKKASKDSYDGKTKEEYDKELKDTILKESNKEPNKKIEELEQSILNLQTTVTDREKTINDLNDGISATSLKNRILSKIPSNTIGLSNETVLNEMRANGYDVSDVDGTLTVTKDGNTLKDNLQNPLNFTDVATQYLTDKNWIKTDKGGRGGGDEGGQGGSKMNYEQFEKQCETKGLNPNSAEAMAEAKQLADDNPEFYN